jgi:hypothetical protein
MKYPADEGKDMARLENNFFLGKLCYNAVNLRIRLKEWEPRGANRGLTGGNKGD